MRQFVSSFVAARMHGLGACFRPRRIELPRQAAGMPRTESDRLHVNLSASQTRKRLKGRGFGVRRVEATGDHQSVIVHTATGGHLRKLESLFADVLLLEERDEISHGGRDDDETAPDC